MGCNFTVPSAHHTVDHLWRSFTFQVRLYGGVQEELIHKQRSAEKYLIIGENRGKFYAIYKHVLTKLEEPN